MSCLSLSEVFERFLKQVGDEVVGDVFDGHHVPAARLEISLVKNVGLVHHLDVFQDRRLERVLLQSCQHVFVLLLRVLHVRLVLHRQVQIHHVFANESLHLKGVEEFLVG